jgi:hypothetical protein
MMLHRNAATADASRASGQATDADCHRLVAVVIIALLLLLLLLLLLPLLVLASGHRSFLPRPLCVDLSHQKAMHLRRTYRGASNIIREGAAWLKAS